jgi:ERF superfamily protein
MDEQAPIIGLTTYGTEIPKPGRVEFTTKSATIGKLAEALAKAQLEFKPVLKDTANPFYKSRYADLATVIGATQPALAKHGLTVVQLPVIAPQGHGAGVKTVLQHVSDEYISVDLILPISGERYDAQTVGSAITYARRYSYQAVVGVAAEVDDDGNSAVGIGSKEAAQAVATKKTADLKAKGGIVPALFYMHHQESDTYEITGSDELKKGYWGILKKFWSPTAKAILCNGEQLDALKFEFEQAHVEFRPLKQPE